MLQEMQVGKRSRTQLRMNIRGNRKDKVAGSIACSSSLQSISVSLPSIFSILTGIMARSGGVHWLPHGAGRKGLTSPYPPPKCGSESGLHALGCPTAYTVGFTAWTLISYSWSLMGGEIKIIPFREKALPGCSLTELSFPGCRSRNNGRWDCGWGCLGEARLFFLFLLSSSPGLFSSGLSGQRAYIHMCPLSAATSADAKLGGFLVLSHFMCGSLLSLGQFSITRMRRKEANGPFRFYTLDVILI